MFGPCFGEQTNEYVGHHIFTNLKTIVFDNFNTSRTKNMEHMFAGCSSLENIDLNGFNTENVFNMDYMFAGCSSLTELDLSSFVTTELQSCAYIVGNCKKLEKLNMSSFSVASDVFVMGVDDDVIKKAFQLSEDADLDTYINTLMSSDSIFEKGVALQALYMRSKNNIKEINLPTSISETAKLYFSTEIELFLKGDESKPLTIESVEIAEGIIDEMQVVTSAEQGMTVKALSNGADTPTTGFVDEQLLPALAIGLVSIIAICYVVGANKKRKFNR